MADAPNGQSEQLARKRIESPLVPEAHDGTTSLGAVWDVLVRHRRFIGFFLGGLSALCLLYCLIAPKQYEAKARVALRQTPPNALGSEGTAALSSRLLALPDVQVETLASEFKSGQLAWRLIVDQKLFQNPGFEKNFVRKFPDFRVDPVSRDSQAYLIDHFEKRLSVQAVPRSLVLEIRFVSKDPGLSAAVVNGLIQDYAEEDRKKRIQSTEEQTEWLKGQLTELKIRVDAGDRRLAEFERVHQLIDTPGGGTNGQPGDTQHNGALLEIDELGKEMATATANRILRETEYEAAKRGDPELVLTVDPGMRSQSSEFGILQQLHMRRGDLEREESLLRLERGPNFPRVVEVQTERNDVDRQITAEDAILVKRLQNAWQAARDRERMVRQSLEATTQEGVKLNEAALEFEVLRAEANGNHELYLRMQQRADEASLEAGIENPDFVVVDPARPPAKPASPNLPLYLALTLFVGSWVALGGAFTLESIAMRRARAVAVMMLLISLALNGIAQAPTPSTSGLPTGVARIPAPVEKKATSSPGDAPVVWEGGLVTAASNSTTNGFLTPMPALIAPGDLVEVSESRTPEIRSAVRVDEAGEVQLPLVGVVKIEGLSEREAARAIEAVLVSRGMLLHPQITVFVTAFVGQDVTVLGEVARPGIYPYAMHHRLLDLISAASGFTANAGSLITIRHRDLGQPSQAVVLNQTAPGLGTDSNPELMAGDTVHVERAGLVYVVGDVLRPGGFAADPVQRLTVLQVLALAWGPTQSASLGKALLIREQAGGRTVTQLNLGRLMRGQDPDQPVMDHDILFVPNSAMKNLLNRSVDSVVQSAAGVSIYAGMVYSQRF